MQLEPSYLIEKEKLYLSAAIIVWDLLNTSAPSPQRIIPSIWKIIQVLEAVNDKICNSYLKRNGK